jgi:uncharacterized membrane protein YgcG
LTAGGTSARADYTSANATLVTNVAATDNVFASPDGDPNREADMFVEVRPGVLLGYETPRMLHQLELDVEALDYVRNYDSESFNLHGGYRARLEPTPLSTFTLAANGLTGRLSQLESYTAPSEAGVLVTPPGKVDVRQADASESYGYQVTPGLHVLQGLEARFSDTNDNVTQDLTSYEAGGTLGLERTWRADAVDVEVGALVLELRRLGPTNGPPDFDRLDHELNPHADLRWRHDYTKKWSSSVDAGLIVVNPYDVDLFLATTRDRQYYPLATAVVAYTDQWGRAQLTGGRTVQPNLFIAENTISDFGLLQLSLPLGFIHTRRGEPSYVGQASLGYAHTALTGDALGGEVGTFNVYHGDVGVSYAPEPGLSYGVRLEYFRQGADAGASTLIGSYSRTTLFATLTARWPSQVTIAAPKTGTSVRADGQDLAPVGEEPVVPDDPTQQQQDRRGQGGGGNQGGNGTSGVSGNGAGTSGTGGSGVSGGVSGGVSNGPPQP